MASSQPKQNQISPASLGAFTTAALVSVFVAFLTVGARAQTFTILHNFTNGAEGGVPTSTLTADAAGNFFGTAAGGGGPYNYGTAFKLALKGPGWTLTPILQFGGSSGINPLAGVVFGPDHGLYGTTWNGDNGGSVFRLTPSPTACKSALCLWSQTVLHFFQEQGGDGRGPAYGNVIFDQAGNVYGTTESGGAYGYGTVYELTPSNGGWTETILYNFTGGSDGGVPYSGVIFDSAGNLYGTTFYGGTHDGGVVYQLAPSAYGWAQSVLYTFDGYSNNNAPAGGLIFDQAGNLYGTTTNSKGASGAGTVFMLSPADGQWTLSVMYSFPGYPGNGPYASLLMDAAGNLYGTTTMAGAYGKGSVFKLTPGSGYWTYTALHDFNAFSDGFDVYGGVTRDQNGNLFGTAAYGGTYGYGIVWEITP